MLTRTRLQDTLFTSDAAWRWFLLGYQEGIQSGYNTGAQSIVDDLKQAGRALDMPAINRAIDAKEARDRRAAQVWPGDDETPEARRRRCAASWGLTVESPA